jgi:hypothetical protein
MAQAVSHRPLTAEARFPARVRSKGICGGQMRTETGFSPSFVVFSLSTSSHRGSPYSYMSYGGRIIGPLVATVSPHWHEQEICKKLQQEFWKEFITPVLF